VTRCYDLNEPGYRTEEPTPVARLNRDALMVCPVCAHVLGGYGGACDYCGTLIDEPLEVETDGFDENDAALVELCRRADVAAALRYAGVCPHAWTQPAPAANDPRRREPRVLRPAEDMPPLITVPVPEGMARCLECGRHVPVAPGTNPMLESTEVTIMRHDEIKTPGYYVISTDRPGRALRQLDVVHIVEVTKVHGFPAPGSHEARFERMGVVERTEGVVPVEQVLRAITDPRKIEKFEAARALAGTWADGPVMHAERWARLSAAMDALHESGAVDESIDRVYTITLTPPEVRTAVERWKKRLAAIESSSGPATGDSARVTRAALHDAELRVHRRATGRHADACEIAFGLVQARRPEGDAYHEDAWAEAAALAEHLPKHGLQLELPDGSALTIRVLASDEVRIAWSDLPGAPFAHLAEYIRAFEFMHEPDGPTSVASEEQTPDAACDEEPPAGG
jgi:hypothetical protein